MHIYIYYTKNQDTQVLAINFALLNDKINYLRMLRVIIWSETEHGTTWTYFISLLSFVLH